MIIRSTCSIVLIILLCFPTLSFSADDRNDVSELSIRLVHPMTPSLPTEPFPKDADLTGYVQLKKRKWKMEQGEVEKYWVNKRKEITEDDLVKVDTHVQKASNIRIPGFLEPTSNENVMIFLEFNNIGSEKLRDITTKHVNEFIAIEFNNELLFVAKVHEPITNGSIYISGLITKDEAKEIEKSIKNLMK